MTVDAKRGKMSPADLISKLLHAPWFWSIVGIVILLALNVAKDPNYLAIQVNPTTQMLTGNLLDIIRVSAPIILIAVGMTFVIATSGIDLSVGSVMAVGGAVAMETLRAVNDPNSVGAMLQAMGLAIALAVVLGLINGVLVAVVGLQPFITTLIMMLAGRGIARVITGGQNANATNEPFRQLANGQVFGLPIGFVFAIGVAVLIALLMRKTALGLIIESIGINPKGSRMAGIRPIPILISVYVIAAVLAALGGMLTVSEVMTVDVSGTGYQKELDAILAVVIGGTSLMGGKFSILGSTIGALLIATLDKTILFLGIPSAATPTFKAVVIIVLCLLQSQRVRALLGGRRPAQPKAAVNVAPPTEQIATQEASA